MQTAWVIAGVILGWESVEFMAALTKVRMPIPLNLGMAFVGGLIAYTIFQ